MKGAIAVPSVKTIKVPNKSKKKTIGASQNFFLTLKNSQNSVIIESLDINHLTLIYLKLFLIVLIYFNCTIAFIPIRI